MTTELSTGKSVLVIAVVLGCFAVLWPKIFYPMVFGGQGGTGGSSQRSYEDQYPSERPHMHHHPGMRPGDPRMRNPNIEYDENGVPRRTVDKELRPGPVPGMRPAMGGPGMHPQPQRQNQQGAMGILMPLYTVGIVIFFVYTIMKLLFKKDSDQDDDRPGNIHVNTAASNKDDLLSSYFDDSRLRQAAAADPDLFFSRQRQQQQKQREEALRKAAKKEDVLQRMQEEDEEDDETGGSQTASPSQPSSPAKASAPSTSSSPRKRPEEKDTKKGSDAKDEEIKLLKDRLQSTEATLNLIMAKLETMQPANVKKQETNNEAGSEES